MLGGVGGADDRTSSTAQMKAPAAGPNHTSFMSGMSSAARTKNGVTPVAHSRPTMKDMEMTPEAKETWWVGNQVWPTLKDGRIIVLD